MKNHILQKAELWLLIWCCSRLTAWFRACQALPRQPQLSTCIRSWWQLSGTWRNHLQALAADNWCRLLYLWCLCLWSVACRDTPWADLHCKVRQKEEGRTQVNNAKCRKSWLQCQRHGEKKPAKQISTAQPASCIQLLCRQFSAMPCVQIFLLLQAAAWHPKNRWTSTRSTISFRLPQFLYIYIPLSLSLWAGSARLKDETGAVHVLHQPAKHQLLLGCHGLFFLNGCGQKEFAWGPHKGPSGRHSGHFFDLPICLDLSCLWWGLG